jgi:catechol 2,3-dioxygenase-like lactoylglutathione lyase family enzyme
MDAMLVTRRAVLGLACFLLLVAAPAAAGEVASAVDSVSITVSDMDRSLAFYEDVLTFEKISEVEVEGDAYERLMGMFGLRMRVARLRLGDEHIELIEVMTPQGRPIPADSRSNDGWFQHVAIIVSDMGRALRGCASTTSLTRLRHRSACPPPGTTWTAMPTISQR